MSETTYIMIRWEANLSNTAIIHDQLPHSTSGIYAGIMALAWSPKAEDELAVRAFDALYVTNAEGSNVNELVRNLPSLDTPAKARSA